MSEELVCPTLANDLRALNRDLDAELSELISLAGVMNHYHVLHWQPGVDVSGEPQWSAAQIAMHVGEFTRFFARHLRRWKADPALTIGRIHTNRERGAAIDAAEGATAVELAGWLQFGCLDLDDALSKIDDFDLRAETVNVKYGVEPLSAFLTRYVVGHKHSHVNQLRQVLLAGRDFER